MRQVATYLAIVIAIVFFGAIGFFSERQRSARGLSSDTTVVSGDTTGMGTEPGSDSDTMHVIQPLDESSTDGGTDAGTTDDGKPVKTIQPIDGDSGV